jgi:hypothetical protein
MSQPPLQDQFLPTDTSLENLWAFLMVTMTMHQEREIARLVATGLPALLPCPLSAVALRQESGPTWHVVLQQAGQLTVSPNEEAFSSALERLFARASAQGQFWLSPHTQHPPEHLLRFFAA